MSSDNHTAIERATKKFHVKQATEEDKLTRCVRAACYDGSPLDVELSLEPIVFWCLDAGLDLVSAVAYWPAEQKLGERVVRAVIKSHGKDHTWLVNELISLAAGWLSDHKAAKNESCAKSKERLVRKFLKVGASLDDLGRFAVIDGSHTDTMPEELSKHAMKPVDEDDLQSQCYVHCYSVFSKLARDDGDDDDDDDDSM
jgi:hypothetical protein